MYVTGMKLKQQLNHLSPKTIHDLAFEMQVLVCDMGGCVSILLEIYIAR